MMAWGPWIKHDGKGCPVPLGFKIMVRACWPTLNKHEVSMGVVTQTVRDSEHWLWPRATKFKHPCYVSEYRIWKPRGMAILEEILTDLPEEVDA